MAILRGIISKDSGVSTFTNDKGAKQEYRRLSIFEQGNSEMVQVSLPVSTEIVGHEGDNVELEVIFNKCKFVKQLA